MGAGCFRISLYVEYLDDAIANDLVAECLFDRDRLNERGRAAVLRVYGVFQLVGIRVCN
jgi:hypothetical protein